mmetsp:Transcript_14200/g.21820  ORF Transcript_14200/g.21820 Transcript_14200/m.21820 type:complete len:385 (-) Transcript_14200:118-1272(-)
MSEKIPTAIVIGASLAGMSAALGLAKIGVKVELIDKRETETRQGAVIGLAANGYKAIEEIVGKDSCVMARLDDIGLPISGTESLMLPWAVIRDALFEQIKANANIQFRGGLSLSGFDDCPKNPKVKVMFSNSDLVLEGDLLVGADGVYSTVRRILGLPCATQIGSTTWRGTVDSVKVGSKLSPLLDKGLMPLNCKEGESYVIVFNFHDKIPGKISWAVSSKDRRAEHCQHPFVLFETIEDRDMADVIKELFDESSRESTEKSFQLSVIDLKSVSDWSTSGGWGGKGRVTLIGDAAHALRPTFGQGVSMAFEDSVVLSRTLKALVFDLQEFSCCDDALRKFEKERLERVKVIWEDQWITAEAGYKNPEKIKPWTEEYRKWLYDGV